MLVHLCSTHSPSRTPEPSTSLDSDWMHPHYSQTWNLQALACEMGRGKGPHPGFCNTSLILVFNFFISLLLQLYNSSENSVRCAGRW